MGIWVVGTSNQLFLRGSKTGANFPKNKVVTGKTPLFEIAHLVVAVLFVLTVVSDRAVLNGNDVFSILVTSTKKHYSRFSKKVLVFQKICFNVKVLKTFETFTGCNIKTCRSLKRRAILKTPSTVFKRNQCFFCWL